MRRKSISLILAAALVGSMLTGCGDSGTPTGGSGEGDSSAVSEESGSEESTQQESESEPSGEADSGQESSGSVYGDAYPLQNAEGKSVTYYTRSNAVFSGYKDYTESPFHTKLAENVGVDIQFEFDPTGTTDDSNYNLVLTRAELPDIILNQFTNAQELLDDGVIIPLNDYMEAWAPNLNKYLNENPEMKKAISTDDGVIYMFPWLREDTWLCTFRGLAIRKDWLEEQNLSEPTNLEELDNVAHVFKEKYNAYFSTVPGWLYDGGISTAFDTWEEYFRDDSQTVHFGPAEEGWREYMQFMNKWYEDGILDPDIASVDGTVLQTKVLNNEVGIAYTSGNNVNNWMNALAEAGSDAVWVGILNPVKTTGGTTMLSQMDQPVTGRGAAVTSSCEDIELAMRVLDYAYSEEGFMYYNYGTEGETYTIEGGVPTFTSLILEDPDGIGNALDKYTGCQWGTAGIQAKNFYIQKNSQTIVDCINTWTTNTTTAQHKFPNVSPTSEESMNGDAVATSLDSYVDEMFYKFIYGEIDIDDDAQWEKYLGELESIGLPKVLEIKQAQLDRYNAR